MGRIVVLHPKPEEVATGVAALRKAGHEVSATWPQGMPEVGPFRRDPPDAFVIDLRRQPSQGRALAIAFRQLTSLRAVPLVFIEGDPEKTDRVKAALPDATFATWRGVRGAVRRALEHTPGAPVIPGTMAGYSGTPLPKKLGIKPGSLVALLGAPRGFEKTLGALPPGVVVRRDRRRPANVLLLFVTSRADLARRLAGASRAMGEAGALWIVWPKKASGISRDLGGNEVREIGLASGLVDYKIAAIDATWSGLCFARRRKKR